MLCVVAFEWSDKSYYVCQLQGCSFGYFVGGWGKPPVDERGRPLYGDVFGLEGGDSSAKGVRDDEEVDQTLWGELESEEEEESEEVSHSNHVFLYCYFEHYSPLCGFPIPIRSHVTMRYRSCDPTCTIGGGGGRGISKTGGYSGWTGHTSRRVTCRANTVLFKNDSTFHFQVGDTEWLDINSCWTGNTRNDPITVHNLKNGNLCELTTCPLL